MGFKKAKAEQAALKVGIYGPPGSGKTFSTLLFAEGLVQTMAKLAGTPVKRIAYADTERGTDFYCKNVPERTVHPLAFDFDAIYTRSITDVLSSLRELKPEEHGVIVIDSMTHIWDACKAAYRGKMNGAGQIPLSAWGPIKKPYKDLMAFLLNCPMHVFILGRQGNEFDKDENGDMEKVGVKMKAEGETAYEPHILLRFEAKRDDAGVPQPMCLAEKDRTGILAGKRFTNPTFADVIKPLLGTLGLVQAKMETEEQASVRDADVIAAEVEAKTAFSFDQVREFSARFDLCKAKADADTLSKEIGPDLKKRMLPSDVDTLREKYNATLTRLRTA